MWAPGQDLGERIGYRVWSALWGRESVARKMERRHRSGRLGAISLVTRRQRQNRSMWKTEDAEEAAEQSQGLLRR